LGKKEREVGLKNREKKRVRLEHRSVGGHRERKRGGSEKKEGRKTIR
jgi:hypothetical protein